MKIIIFLLCTSWMYSQTDSESYFPLALSNKWIYQSGIYEDTISVIDTQTVQSKLYYALKEDWLNKYFWFRKENEKIYIVDTTAIQLNPSGVKEYLLYDFTGVSNDSIDVPLKDFNLICLYNGRTILVNTNDTSITPAGIFYNCYSFSRIVPCFDAGRISEWFAPGTGKVEYHDVSIAGLREYFLKYADIVTGINNGESHIHNYELMQNYPNPFNPSTYINYTIPEGSNVEIKIYNSLGEEITTLINEFKNSGKYRIIYNTPGLSSGVYFCKMKAGEVVLTKKMILLR